MTRLWEKGEPLDDLVLRFTAGDDPRLDARLVVHDVRATIAHARMLSERGFLSLDDFSRVESALQVIGREHAEGRWSIALEDEDVHTALENRLVAAVGEPGLRIHLGRSRNDQVLAALRLWLKDEVAALMDRGQAVADALSELAARQGLIALPGYTHMQRAMPSSVGLWAGGFRAEIIDDLEGLEASLRRIDKNPLGSAAGYGVPVLGIDGERTRQLLGFARVHEPVTAVQLSRGKAEAGFLFETVLLLQDVGRMASDLVLFATAEYGFVSLAAGFTTGSSIMPQKRNPDVLELIRAHSALAVADLDSVLALTAKMSSGYHRDFQLTKGPLFRGADRARLVLEVSARVLEGVRFDESRTRAALDAGLFATERAMQLVREEGIPFRTAYRRIAAESTE